MAIEAAIEKLNSNIEKLIALQSGKAAGTVAGKATTKAPALDLATVKAAAGKVMDKLGKPKAKALIAKVGGAPELAGVKPENYAKLMAAFEKAMTPDEEPEEVPDDDDEDL